MNGWHWTDEPNPENIIFEGHSLPAEAPLKVHFNYWFYVHLIYFNVTNTQGDLVLLRLKLLVINLPAVPSGGRMHLWRTQSQLGSTGLTGQNQSPVSNKLETRWKSQRKAVELQHCYKNRHTTRDIPQILLFLQSHGCLTFQRLPSVVMAMSATPGGCGEADSSVKWQLCYDVTAKTWWMVSLTSLRPQKFCGSSVVLYVIDINDTQYVMFVASYCRDFSPSSNVRLLKMNRIGIVVQYYKSTENQRQWMELCVASSFTHSLAIYETRKCKHWLCAFNSLD